MDLTSAFTWRTASKSGNNGGNCVEVGTATDRPVVLIRDTKARECGHLTVTREAFGQLIAKIKNDLQPRAKRTAPGRSRSTHDRGNVTAVEGHFLA